MKDQQPHSNISLTGTGNKQTVIQHGNHVGTNYGVVTQSQNGGVGSSSIVVSSTGSNTVNINGKTFTGRKVEQRDGRIFVDDVDVTDEVGEGNRAFNVTIAGSVDHIEGCQQVVVSGNANKVESVSGAIEIKGDVKGNVESMSGSIRCGKVAGKVTTMSGSIRTA